MVVLLLLLPPVVAAQSAPLEVRGLAFEGNRAIDDLTLASQIATSNSSIFATSPLLSWLGLGSTRTFSELDLRADVLRIELLYRASGYLDVLVDTVVTRKPESVSIKFRITEGEPVRVTGFTVSGLDEVADRDRVVRGLPLEEGDAFSRFAMWATADTLTDRLSNAGYPSAMVTTEFDSDSVRRAATVRVTVAPGTPAVFGPMRVQGVEKIDTAFVRSLAATRPGEPFRVDALYRAQRSLYGTELFSYATVRIDSSRFVVGDSIVPLVTTVVEGLPHRASGSGGYATNDCFRAGAGWTARNFLGSGRQVSLTGRLSKIGVGTPLDFGAEESICSPLKADTVGSRQINYGLEANIRRFGFLSPDNVLVLAVFAERRSEYTVYQREEVGVGASVTRETARRIPITLSYEVSYGATQANSVSFCQFFNACIAADVVRLRERRVSSRLSLAATRQRLDNFLEPTRGSILSVEATVSSSLLGSSELEQFTRLVGDATGYLPLGRSVVLAGHLRGGLILAPRVDLASGSANFVPPEQRFYAGGPSDVRGYDRNELGPVVYVVPREDVTFGADTTFPPGAARVAATGGDRVAVANLELRLPSPVWSSRLRFVVFLDAGALWSGQGTGRMRFTPGFGTRFSSPLGPVRFDFGYNSYRLEAGPVFTATEGGDLVQVAERFVRDRRKDWTIHFSIGHAF
jgi:outer membrane protein insertion porin family/translocation and assembly module TamA